MEMDQTEGPVYRPPLRKFKVCTVDGDNKCEYHEITAHLVFNNNSTGEGLIFRRYYDNNVRTEVVGQFLNWVWHREVSTNGE